MLASESLQFCGYAMSLSVTMGPVPMVETMCVSRTSFSVLSSVVRALIRSAPILDVREPGCGSFSGRAKMP